jgi:hypothetical protein
MTLIKSDSSLLSYLFHKGRFEVPWHQRYYGWVNENVAELLQDIDEAFRENRKCYFLGTIILVERPGSIWEINDGQQRMVTFSLICARLARIFSDGVDTRSEAIALRILFDIPETHTYCLSESDDLVPRLTTPYNDKSRYHLMIRGKNIGTNGKLTAAWKEIDKYFLSMDTAKAKQIFNFIINKLEIAYLIIPDELDPNSIFETLNARGKPLGGLDLIRNHIYSFFSSSEEKARRDTVHDSLERLRVQLREDKKETNALEYMRCCLQCTYGFLPDRSFYRETKEKIKAGYSRSTSGPDYVFKLVEDISCGDKVEVFHIISNPSENDSLVEYFLHDSNQRGKSRHLFVFLRELRKYTVTRPIVFALMNHYAQEKDGRKKKRIAKFVHTRMKLLTSFVIRTAFVAQKFEPSHFESEFSDLAQKIMSTESLDTIPFARVLRDRDEYGVFDDSSFIEKIKQATIRDNTKAKRFLLGLVYQQQPEIIAVNEARYTVEHILPKSDTHLSGWPNFDEREHAENAFLIGNLTLLGGTDNKPGNATNSSFSRKKEIYKNSAIALTRDIAMVSDWSPAEIQKRQEYLAKLAARVWELPDVS